MRVLPWASLSVAWFVLAGCPASETVWEETQSAVPSGLYPSVQRFERPPVTARLEWEPSTSAAVPLSLTASDGAGLRLVALEADVVIEDPLAFTELHLTFANTENRVREGRFELELPDGAAMARLAIKIGDTWQEGAIVERGHARTTFESYMHERPKLDPVLLEPAAGNRFSARVFPIPARANKELVVSYSQALRGEAYRLPLQGLPAIDDIDIAVHVRGTESTEPLSFVHERFEPSGDLRVPIEGVQAAVAVTGGQFAVARIRPTTEAAADPVDALTILVDTSASMGPHLDDAIERLHDVIAILAQQRELSLRVIAFDQEQEEIFAGAAAEFGASHVEALQRRRAFGASNLHAALAYAGAGERAPRRIVLVGDGIATAGPGSPEIDALLGRLARHGLSRIDAIAPTGTAELRRLVVGPLPHAGLLLTLDREPDSTAAALQHASLQGIGVAVEGATFTWPDRLHGVHPGDEVLVFARFDVMPNDPLRIVFDGGGLPAQELVPLVVARPLVERAVACARIERVQRALADTAGDRRAQLHLHQKLVELSKGYHVLSDATSLLVLESDAEYAMFGISREATPNPIGVRAAIVTLLGPSVERTEIPPDYDVLGSRFVRNAGIVALARAWSRDPYGRAYAVGDPDEDVWGGLGETPAGGGFLLGGDALVGSDGKRPRAAVQLGASDFDGLGLASQLDAASQLAAKSLALAEAHTRLAEAHTRLAEAHTRPAAAHTRPAAAIESTASTRRTPTGLRSSAPRWRWGSRPIPITRASRPSTSGAIDSDRVHRIVSAHLDEVRFCHGSGLALDPGSEGVATAAFTIDPDGSTRGAKVTTRGTLAPRTPRCIERAIARWRFPLLARPTTVAMEWSFDAHARPRARKSPRAARAPHEGGYAAVHAALHDGATADAIELAEQWVAERPRDVVALLALGEAHATAGRDALAARIYGSIIDLHPDRADLRRVAGERLQTIALARAVAVDTFEKAIAQRPEQLSAYRLLAMALVEHGDPERAFIVLRDGLRTLNAANHFDARGVLAADLELIGAIWAAAAPDREREIDGKLEQLELRRETEPSARVVLHWETDASDVDLHIAGVDGPDPEVRVDVADGYGPEYAIIRGDLPHAVRVAAHHYARGPVGYAGGTLHVVVHDGKGTVRIETRPYLLMNDRGLLDLGTFSL